MMNKPNQTIDEISGAVYPPSEAIAPQLATIRSIASSTIKVYEATKDIHSIFPNLNTMQEIINYLRGAPKLEFPQEPEDTLKPSFSYGTSGLNVTCTMDKGNYYNIEIVGLNVDPIIQHPELYGSLDVDAIDFDISIPVICGETYTITQYNDMLKYFPDDPSIADAWVKNKQYTMEEDHFEYSFLIGKGRSSIEIYIEDSEKVYACFNITSHIHFKEKEIAPEPEEGEDTNEDDSANG